MAVHHLKTWPTYFQAIKRGDKTFELRLNDRDFREGDTLFLQEWNPMKGDGAFTGAWLPFKAGWILYGGNAEFGCPALPHDHCIISLVPHPADLGPGVEAPMAQDAMQPHLRAVS